MSVLATENLGFSYGRGGEELFGGLTHSFTPGRLTALVGPSGRGKSTLLYILGLMLTPTRGFVTFAHERVSELPDHKRSRFRANQIGFVFQDSALDPTRPILSSVMEPALYAGWSLPRARSRAMELLIDFGIGERVEHRPGEISGGQAQRVATCRALMVDPAVILADEPTGNLDRDNATLVLDSLRRTLAGDRADRTIIIATHDPYVVDNCDEVVTL